MERSEGISRRRFMRDAGLAVGAMSLASCVTGKVSAPKVKPNILFILTDDQRWDAMSCMGHPFLKTPHMDRIRKEGVMFKNAFVTTSLCAPSRASFLTGMYAHMHGVTGNWGCEYDFEATPSFPHLLQKSGYHTAFVGKWHMKRTAEPRPGFDHWLSFSGQGVYMDPPMNENGREFKAKGYMTDLLTDAAIKYIKEEKDKPFCLYLSHKAVHSPFDPGPKHKNSYADVELEEPESWKDTFEGKPKWTRGGKAYKEDKIDNSEVPDSKPPRKWNPKHERFLNYMRTINAVDDGIGRILKVLEEEGKLDDTVVVFAGDNGYFIGEHGRGDKRLIYEESIRIPLLMRYPSRVKAGSSVEQIVLNIDIAPTMLELAGAPVPEAIQGRSVAPLLDGKADGWRKSFLYSYWMDLTDRLPHMLGVRTEDWKFATYPDIDDIDEMYDLKKDPHEMTNLALEPEHAEKHKELSAELERLLKETGYGTKPIPKDPYVKRKRRWGRRRR